MSKTVEEQTAHEITEEAALQQRNIETAHKAMKALLEACSPELQAAYNDAKNVTALAICDILEDSLFEIYDKLLIPGQGVGGLSTVMNNLGVGEYLDQAFEAANALATMTGNEYLDREQVANLVARVAHADTLKEAAIEEARAKPEAAEAAGKYWHTRNGRVDRKFQILTGYVTVKKTTNRTVSNLARKRSKYQLDVAAGRWIKK